MKIRLSAAERRAGVDLRDVLGPRVMKKVPRPPKTSAKDARDSLLRAVRATQDGWTPVRRGAIFCSPLCGGNCTHAAYLRAKRAATALAKELGPLWEPIVNENLGWHWKVRTRDGRLKLHPSGYDASFTAFLSPEDSDGGTLVASGASPILAIRLVQKEARAYAASARSMLAVCEDALRSK